MHPGSCSNALRAATVLYTFVDTGTVRYIYAAVRVRIAARLFATPCTMSPFLNKVKFFKPRLVIVSVRQLVNVAQLDELVLEVDQITGPFDD